MGFLFLWGVLERANTRLTCFFSGGQQTAYSLGDDGGVYGLALHTGTVHDTAPAAVQTTECMAFL